MLDRVARGDRPLRRAGCSARGAAGRGALLLAALLLAASGCRSVGTRLALPFLYEEAPAEGTTLYADLPYRLGEDAHPRKHRLDLVLPAPAPGGAAPRPEALLAFVHGGGWTSGDKGFEAGGADIYRNLGRFLAARGIAVALVNYRLQPEVDWRAQVGDVADAVAWLRENAARFGVPPHRLFLGGHSAGAQLVAHVALDPQPLAERGLRREALCGVVAVSGSAYDLTDAETWERGLPRDYFAARFRAGPEDRDWAHEASPLRGARAGAPPFLILVGEEEPAGLRRQSQLLHQGLRRRGDESRLRTLANEGHLRILLALSRPGGPASRALRSFLTERECAAPPRSPDGGPAPRYPESVRRPPDGGPA